MLTPEFRKASYSNHNQDCVECSLMPGAAGAIRDTKNREEGHLAFPPAEWNAFLVDLKRGPLAD